MTGGLVKIKEQGAQDVTHRNTLNMHNIDFSLSVKVVTLIFVHVYGCGSAISSAKQGKSGYIYNLVKNKISCFGRAKVRAFHENPNRIHTEVTFINP